MGWKLWIVCAVLFAILLPGVKYVKDARAYKAAQQPQDNQEVIFTKEEQQQIDDVKSLQDIFGFATPQAIYKWQQGVALPTIDNLVALAAVLQVRLDDILVIDTAAQAQISA